MSEFNYELKDPIKFTPDSSGDQVDATFIQLREITCHVKELELCAILKEQFYSASANLPPPPPTPPGATPPVKKVEMITGPDLIKLLYAGERMAKCLVAWRQLIKIVGKIEGHRPMTDPLFAAMTLPDAEGSLGEYLANFPLHSDLKELAEDS